MDPIRFAFREGNELKFNLKEAKEIFNSIGERPLVIYAVVGLPNTGKSYLLNWFAVYLDKLSQLLENVSTIDDFNNLISDIDFLKQSEYVQRFKCNEGTSGGTTGVLLSQPFILSIPHIVNNTIQSNKKEVAVLLLDAEGLQDYLMEGRDPEQDKRVFILTTLMSSVMIINDASANRFLHDKTYEYFDCFNGYGAHDQGCLNEDESRNKPFQKLVFLKRNWDDTDSYDYGFHNNDEPEDKNIFKDQLMPTNVQSEHPKRILKIIHKCFPDLTAFLLPNPGPKLRKEKSVDKTCDEFKEYLKKFICEMLPIKKADQITHKAIDGCEVTGVNLILYVEKWINTLNQKEIDLANVISKATAETKCLIAKNRAVDHYQLEMYNTVIFSDPPVSEELFDIEHKKVLDQCLEIFNQQKCSFWFDIEKHHLEEVNSEIDRLVKLLSTMNHSLHEQAKARWAIVRASQEFLSNPTTEGMFPEEIINLYHKATVWAYEGEFERADECYEQIKKWSIESRHWRADLLTPVDELEVHSNQYVYRMRRLPRGYCVIINNEEFISLSRRRGSQADVTGLAMVFRNLGFVISILENLTKNDMCLQLRAISQDESLFLHDAIVISILSHGDDNFIYGTDAQGIKHDDIFNMFSNSNCPQLNGKPKIFVVQCCRGSRTWSESFRALQDRVADAHELRPDSGIIGIDGLALNTDTIESELGNENPLTDAVIWYSTIKNYVSWRNTESGTYFIQAFVKVMEKATPKEDFLSIVQEVNREVQKSLGKRAKESKLKQATELQLRGWIGKLYLKTIDVDKKETKKIHENPSSFEKMQVILIEDKSLLEKITNKINISKSTVECGICVKIFKNPSFDSMHSSVKNQQLTDDLKEQYHILLDLEDNENVQTFRMDSSNLKQQIDDIFESYSKRFISFTRYYIDDIGNGKINGHQLENIYQYMSEYPDHCLAHFAAAFGCSKYFDYEESTNASSSNFSVTQDSVKRIEYKAENSHMTPIHAALVSRHNMHNKKIVVEKLLALGADLSARDKYSNTVLHFSANTNKEIVGILLSDHGIRQLSLKQDLCNCDNERPHDWAAYFGNNEVYQLLFEFYKQNKTDSVFQPDSQTTGNIDTDSFGSSTFKNFTQKIGLISFRSFVKRKGPLSLFFHLNLKSDFFPSLKSGKELIKLGVNVNAMDTEENTPLQLICANKEIKEIDHKLKWLLLLLTANAETNAKDKDGNTALHHLVSLDDRMGVKALLVFGADPSICNNYNRTPYRLATNENMKKLLKEIGLEVINDRSTSTDITPSSSTTILMPSSSTSLLHIKIGNTTGSKVLCLDGGGIKGLNILEILDQIEKMTKKSIIDSFDWVVGTSTGGIIALAFAAGRTVRQCKNLYFKLKDKVFGNVWDKITGQNSARLEKILQAEFLDLKMSGLIESQIKVAIATTALIGGNPTLVIYPNYKIDEWKNSDNYKFRDEFVWKVGRMTSAAPWYFKSVDNTFDGGLLANNPTLDALVQVSKYNEVHNIDQGIDPVIVSIGSGSWSKENTNDSESQNSYASCNIFTTLLQAFKTLKKSAIITDGHVVDHAERALKNGSYIRLQPQLTTKIKMDETNTEDLLNMMWETKVYMYQIREEINEFMNILK